jgi:hypothetical protein
MDDQGDHREQKQQVKQHASNVEHEEAKDPHNEQQQCDSQKWSESHNVASILVVAQSGREVTFHVGIVRYKAAAANTVQSLSPRSWLLYVFAAVASVVTGV